ncbi:MAG: response regulator transcription factor [Candidatus Sericytochromatia bacterium]|nr:response regulator transcription factor [Candidatus Sericytochromatia bacterium]
MSSPQTTLIAHRDLGVRRRIGHCLQQHDEARVVRESVDGLTTCAIARLELPFLVFVDLALPHHCGWDSARCVRHHIPTCRIVLLMEGPLSGDLMARRMGGIGGNVGTWNREGLVTHLADFDDRRAPRARQAA